jgi:hypothetical protein
MPNAVSGTLRRGFAYGNAIARTRYQRIKIGHEGFMMFSKATMVGFIAGVFLASASFAQAPASAPAGSTGLCRDGSYWTGATKRGACRGHKGVQDWYAGAGSASDASSAAAPAAATPAPAAAAPAAPVAAAPAAAPAPPPAPAAPVAPKASSTPAAAAPGGGPGQVWVNSASHVYHCPSDRWYGKTKSGEYMSESDAIAKGNRADHGKACQK